ncbi:hypothetical protein JHK86_054903 [Glycine max]|nr:hypothetical protein JHK86_054903 [Glycine max]
MVFKKLPQELNVIDNALLDKVFRLKFFFLLLCLYVRIFGEWLLLFPVSLESSNCYLKYQHMLQDLHVALLFSAQ